MICNKCGENLAEDSEFCMACGNSVKEQTEQQEAEAQPCENQEQFNDESLQPCENQEQFNDESVQPQKRSKKKTLLCVIAVVLALAFVLGGISSAVAIFSGDGPISEIGEALENGIEDGFAFEFTLSIPDESEYTVKGVTLGTSDDENAIPVTYLTIGDLSYYVDNDCVCVLDETTMNLLNLNYKEEGDEQSNFSLMKEILAADLEKLVKFEDFCDLAEYLNCFAGERIYDEGGFEKCADRIANNLKDKDYLKENFGYKEKSRKNRTEITFEFDAGDVVKLMLNEFKNCRDAYVWEQDYEIALEELKELKEARIGDDVEIEIEFVLEDDYLTSVSLEITEPDEDESTVALYLEFSDFGEAELDSDVADMVSEGKEKLGDLESISRSEENGYYYYDDEGEKILID